MSVSQTDSVLITGGRGFIGRALVKLLRRSGYAALSLDQAPVTEPDKHGSEILCDVSDREQLRQILEQEHVGGVVHLAAILPTAAQREPVRATQVNVGASLELLDMTRELGVRRFVFASSLSIYGTWSADHVVSESDRAAPEDLYGAAKLYVEQIGQAYRQRYGLEFVSLRIGRVVGAGAQSATSAWRSQIFELLGTGHTAQIEIPYAASERILLVHVEDVARMLMILLEAAQLRQSIYNAVCESVVAGDLKREVEKLNPEIVVKLGGASVVGNPGRLDCSRFQAEFGLQALPIFEQLRTAAGGWRRTAGADDTGKR